MLWDEPGPRVSDWIQDPILLCPCHVTLDWSLPSLWSGRPHLCCLEPYGLGPVLFIEATFYGVWLGLWRGSPASGL